MPAKYVQVNPDYVGNANTGSSLWDINGVKSWAPIPPGKTFKVGLLGLTNHV